VERDCASEAAGSAGARTCYQRDRGGEAGTGTGTGTGTLCLSSWTRVAGQLYTGLRRCNSLCLFACTSGYTYSAFEHM